MVSSLKLSSEGWDEEKINRLFDQELTKCIRGMFWATNDQEDKLIWTKTKFDQFSVKSAYKLEETNEGNSDSWWNALWRSRIHERTKLFLWKLANNGLPVTTNLAARGMAIENVDCIHGCHCMESEVHLFFQCKVVKRFWFASSWGINWKLVDGSNLMAFLNNIMNPVGILLVHPEDKDFFFSFSATMLEQIWWTRNKKFHEDVAVSVDHSMTFIRNRVNEQIEAHKREERARQMDKGPRETNNRLWRRPPVDFIKVNSDVALKGSKSALAMVARDYEGNVLLIHTFKTEVSILEVAETETIWKAMQMAQAQGWPNVIFESDALAIINAVNKRDKSSLHWTADKFFDNIQLYSVNFISVTFDWVPRSANRMAHNVSQWLATQFIFGPVEPCWLPPTYLNVMTQESVPEEAS